MKRMVESEIADILNEKLQVDENGVELKDNLAIEGYLHADGKISGREIIEDMAPGYTFTVGNRENFVYNPIYAGVSKTGNKLTIVLAINITKQTGESTNICPLGSFTIPKAIGEKLQSTIVGGSSVLETRAVLASRAIYNSTVVSGFVNKDSDTKITLGVSNLAGMTADIVYYMRYELTLLLSENLIAE